VGNLLSRVGWGWSSHYYAVEFRHATRWDQSIPRDAVQIREIDNGVSWLQKSNGGSFELLPGDYLKNTSENLLISVLGIDSAQSNATVRVSGIRTVVAPPPMPRRRRIARLAKRNHAGGWQRHQCGRAIDYLQRRGANDRHDNRLGSTASIDFNEGGRHWCMRQSTTPEHGVSETLKPRSTRHRRRLWRTSLRLNGTSMCSGVGSATCPASQIQFQASGANPIN
jgi:hypothetical protein